MWVSLFPDALSARPHTRPSLRPLGNNNLNLTVVSLLYAASMLLCWNAHFLLYSVNSTHTLLNSAWMSLLGSFPWLLPPIQGVPFLCCPSTNDTPLSWSRELSFCPTSPRALLVLYWMYVPRARARAENREGALKRTFHDQMQGRMNPTMWLFNSDGVGVINWIRFAAD